MKRNEVVNNIMRIAQTLSSDYSKENERKCFVLALEYNDSHDDEIFVCEIENGIMVEDDVFYF